MGNTFTIILEGYIVCIGHGDIGTEITESEYNTILQKIKSRPAYPEGYTYKLRADDLEWELEELPEPVDESAEISDYENALADMGVRFGD